MQLCKLARHVPMCLCGSSISFDVVPDSKMNANYTCMNAWSATKEPISQTKTFTIATHACLHEWMSQWKNNRNFCCWLWIVLFFVFLFSWSFYIPCYRMNNRRQSISMGFEIHEEFGLWLLKSIVINVDNWLNHWNWVNYFLSVDHGQI